VRQALGKIMAFSTRDNAALDAARELLKAGRRADAIAIAQTITAVSLRDDALKEMAQ
jgi:hypothetical protein